MWTADGVAICTAAGYRVNPRIASDQSGGAIITWHDNRNGTNDIFAQCVDANGIVQWTVDGVAICATTADQRNCEIATDGDEVYQVYFCREHTAEYQDDLRAIATDIAEMAEGED